MIYYWQRHTVLLKGCLVFAPSRRAPQETFIRNLRALACATPLRR